MPVDIAAAFIAFNCTPGAWIGIPAAISYVYDGRNSTKTNALLKKLRAIDPDLDDRISGLSEDLVDPAIEMLEEVLQNDPRLRFIDDDPSGSTLRFYIQWLLQLCTESGYIFAFVEDGIVRGVALVLPPDVPLPESSPVFFRQQSASKVKTTISVAMETKQDMMNLQDNLLATMSPRRTEELRFLRLLCAKNGVSNEGPRKLLQARLEAAFGWSKAQLQEEMTKIMVEEQEEDEKDCLASAVEVAPSPPMEKNSPAAMREAIAEGREIWELRHLRTICQKHGLSRDGSEDELSSRISAGLGWGAERFKKEVGALIREELRGAFHSRKHLSTNLTKRLDVLGDGMYSLFTEVAKSQDLRFHWHLCLLGVRKSGLASGVDVGGALMQVVTTAADNTGLPIYAEVGSEEGAARAENFEFSEAGSRQLNFETCTITAVKKKDRADEILEEYAAKSSRAQAMASGEAAVSEATPEGADEAADAAADDQLGQKQAPPAGPGVLLAMVRFPTESAIARCRTEMGELFDFEE